MYCSSCGCEIPDGVNYCPECGTAASETLQTPENTVAVNAVPQKTLKKSTAIVIASGLAVLFLVLIALVIILNSRERYSSAFAFPKGELLVVEGDKSLSIYSTEGGSANIDLNDYYSFKYDFGTDILNTRAFVYIETESDKLHSSHYYYLYYFDGDSFTEVYSSATPLSAYYMSEDGSTLVYIIYSGIYYYKYGEAVNKTSVASGKLVSSMSPDGIVGYISGYGTGTNGSYYDGNENHSLNDSYAIALSPGAELIYLLKRGNSQGTILNCSVKKRGEQGVQYLFNISEKNIDDLEYYFNTDFTQMLKYEKTGTYLSIDGGKLCRISNSRCYPIFYKQTEFEGTDPYFDYRCRDYRSIYFLEQYTDDNGETLCRIIKTTGEGSEVIVQGLKTDFSKNSCLISDDGKKIWYCSEKKIYTLDAGVKNAEPKQLCNVDGSYKWYVTGDAKKVYYCDYGTKIFAKSANSKYVKQVFLSEDKNDKKDFCMSVFNDRLFFVSGGKLYTSTGGSAKRVSGVPEGVKDVSCGRHMVLVSTENGDIYVSFDGGNFTKLSGGK